MIRILITGVSGIGKSTLTEKLCKELNFFNLKVSRINFKIANRKFFISTVDDIKSLTKTQLDEVHMRAKSQIKNIMQENQNVIIDDHLFVKYEKNKLKLPPKDYFNFFEITLVILLVAKPKSIFKRRNNDHTRKRDIISIEEINYEQEFLKKEVSELSKKNSVTFSIYQVNDYFNIINSIKKQMISHYE